MKVFISGSISIKLLPKKVLRSINKIIEQNFEILVGDADGIDRLICEYAYGMKYTNLIIYHVDKNPRQNINLKFKNIRIETDKNIKKEREKQYFKDKAMAQDCDFAFVIWDGKSKGSYQNIKNCIEFEKKIKIYLKEKDDFIKPDLDEVNFVYSQNNGYTSSEALEFIKQEFGDIFKNTQNFNKFLVEKGFFLTKSKDDKIYKPAPKYQDMFLTQTHQGQISCYKLTDILLNEISKEIKKDRLF